MKFRKLDAGHKNYWNQRVSESYNHAKGMLSEKMHEVYSTSSSKSRCLCIHKMFEPCKNMKDAFLSALLLGINQETFSNLIQFVNDMEEFDAEEFVNKSEYNPDMFGDDDNVNN